MLKHPCYIYGPEGPNVSANLNIGDFVVKKMWEFKENAAWIHGITDETITYKDILQATMNIAVSLTHIGVKRGDVIGICTENRKEYWGAAFGIICTGATLTTLNPMYSEGELKHVLKISKPKYVFCSPNVFEKHEKTLNSQTSIKKLILFGERGPKNVLYYNDMAIPDSVNNGTLFKNNRLTRNVAYEEFVVADVQGQSDVVIILYSSGTTGLPKGVMITHYNLLTTCYTSPTLDPGLPGLSVTPWYHTMGLTHGICSAGFGKTTYYLPKFDVDSYLKTIGKYKLQQFTVVPPIVVSICKSQVQYDLSSIQVVYSGAAPLLTETIASLKKKFTNLRGVIQGYGMTESSLAPIRGHHENAEQYKPGSIGVVSPSFVVKVVDIDTRQPLGPNKPGEICIKGPTVMKGYLGADTTQAFDEEGFYKTGDIGYYDDDKHFFIVDRLKELIKYKGSQVPPVEIEAVLLQHEAVADAAVIGLPDTAAGELPLAYVVKQPGKTVTEKELQQFVAERISNPKRLRGGVRFISEIPKNPSGKILRRQLKLMAMKPNSKL